MKIPQQMSIPKPGNPIRVTEKGLVGEMVTSVFDANGDVHFYVRTNQVKSESKQGFAPGGHADDEPLSMPPMREIPESW